MIKQKAIAVHCISWGMWTVIIPIRAKWADSRCPSASLETPLCAKTTTICWEHQLPGWVEASLTLLSWCNRKLNRTYLQVYFHCILLMSPSLEHDFPENQRSLHSEGSTDGMPPPPPVCCCWIWAEAFDSATMKLWHICLCSANSVPRVFLETRRLRCEWGKGLRGSFGRGCHVMVSR